MSKSRKSSASKLPPAIVAFAKNSNVEPVKTRLAASIGVDAAKTIYEAMLKDTLNNLNLNLNRQATKYIATSSSSQEPYFSTLAREFGCSLVDQKGDNLGDRMLNCIREVGKHHSPVLIVGTDAPLLPMDAVNLAIVEQDDWDITIGPTFDGGYYLIGMSEPHKEIFSNISWSTDSVLSQTRNCCMANDLRVWELEPCLDVDDLESLKSLYHVLNTYPEAAPRTVQICRDLGL